MKTVPATHDADDLRNRIKVVRGMAVILDSDLARAYGVTTAALNQAVKRNRNRFPSEFVFIIDPQEVARLISQIVISNALEDRSQFVTGSKRGGRRKATYAFTEHGALMASMVLNSPRAVQMSVFVVKAFVAMRSLLSTQRGLAKKVAELERALTERLDTHEHAITDIIQQIMHLLAPAPEPESESPRPRIGYDVRERRALYRTRSSHRKHGGDKP